MAYEGMRGPGYEGLGYEGIRYEGLGRGTLEIRSMGRGRRNLNLLA